MHPLSPCVTSWLAHTAVVLLFDRRAHMSVPGLTDLLGPDAGDASGHSSAAVAASSSGSGSSAKSPPVRSGSARYLKLNAASKASSAGAGAGAGGGGSSPPAAVHP